MKTTNLPPAHTRLGQEQKHVWKAYVNRRHMFVITLLLCGFGLIAAAVIAVSDSTYIWSRLTVLGVLFFLLSTTLAEKAFEARIKQKPWNELAQRTGLAHQNAHFWLGRPERVTGIYRGYLLTLYASRMARGHIPGTRIELVLPRPRPALLRLRGPYEAAEVVSEAAFDQVFGGGSLYHIGYERFFIRSRPAHLSRALFGTNGRYHAPLRYRLLKLKRITNIEMDGYRLHLEEFGAVLDVDYLHLLFDLLCDIADEVENAYLAGQPDTNIEQAA